MIPIPYPSPRVAQLDAHILDSELVSLLKQNLVSIFHHHSNKWWTYDQHPELWDLFLNIWIFKLTTWKSGSSYGLSLQNLKLSNSRTGRTIGSTKRAVLLAFIIGDYLFTKFQSYLYAQNGTQDGNTRPTLTSVSWLKSFMVTHKDTILTKINNTLKVLNLLNFTIFLLNGKYPSLIHRAIGISLTPIVTDLLKFNGDKVNFEFQNRQLVWNVMTEFLVFILPLLQLKKLRHMSKKLLSPYRKTDQVQEKSPLATLPISQCAICHYKKDMALMAGEKKMASLPCTVTNAYVTNCGHIYCYICIASAFSAIETSDGKDTCLRCGEKFQWFKKWGEDEGDIDQDAIMVEYEEEEEEEDLKEKVGISDSEDNDESGDDSESVDSRNSESDLDQDQAFDEDGGVDEDLEDDGDEAGFDFDDGMEL